MILLDTQALVWLMEGSSRLGLQARRAEAESEVVATSAISFWEIGLLVSRNKLTLPVSMDRWADMVEHEAAIEYCQLPARWHSTPGCCPNMGTAIRAIGSCLQRPATLYVR